MSFKRHVNWFAAATVGLTGVAGALPIPAHAEQETPPAARPPAAAPPEPSSIARSNADRRIADDVQSRLKSDDVLLSQGIGVESRDNVVILSGTVNNLLARRRAAELAGTIRGVKEVQNHIQVRPVARPDLNVEDDVVAALQQDPATRHCDISPRVHGGMVMLSGSVDSWEQKRVAGLLAEGVPGVTALEDKLQVRYPALRSDAAVEADVRSRIRWDPWLKNPELTVSVSNSVVAVSGYVTSAFQRQRVFDDAWVSGTSAVVPGGIKVVPNIREAIEHPSAPLAPTGRVQPPADDDVSLALKQAFADDPRVDSSNIGIEVQDGAVTLTGHVATAGAKTAAGEIAEALPGVVNVQDFLQVRPAQLPSAVGAQASRPADDPVPPRVINSFPPASDESIKADTEQQIAADPALSQDAISVGVRDGVVTLRGTVGSWTQREMAARYGYDSGATGVLNELKVNHLVPPPQ